MSDTAHSLAVDLGGTNTRVALVAPDGTVTARDEEPTARKDQHPGELIEHIRRVADGHEVDVAVAGVPGRVDHRSGRLEFAPNLPPTWAASLTEAWLAEETGLRVALANDADLAAVGEHRFGAGRGVDDMVYVTMSTGVGGGAIIGGRLVRGHRSMLEIGHTTIDRRDPGPGRTLEGAASGAALVRLAELAGLDARGPAIVDLVKAGDANAVSIWKDLAEAAAFGMANLAHLFSPQLIVVGGGLGLVGDLLYEPMRDAVATYGPRDLPEPIRIEPATLGDDAGLIGAADWLAAIR